MENNANKTAYREKCSEKKTLFIQGLVLLLIQTWYLLLCKGKNLSWEAAMRNAKRKTEKGIKRNL